MGGEVLVALLVTGVLGDVVKVFSADDEGAVHLGGNDGAGKDTTADRDLAGEGALLVDVGALNGSGGGTETQTDVLVPSAAALAGASRLRLGLLVKEDTLLLLESPLGLDGQLGSHLDVVVRSTGRGWVLLRVRKSLMLSRNFSPESAKSGVREREGRACPEIVIRAVDMKKLARRQPHQCSATLSIAATVGDLSHSFAISATADKDSQILHPGTPGRKGGPCGDSGLWRYHSNKIASIDITLCKPIRTLVGSKQDP